MSKRFAEKEKLQQGEGREEIRKINGRKEASKRDEVMKVAKFASL